MVVQPEGPHIPVEPGHGHGEVLNCPYCHSTIQLEPGKPRCPMCRNRFQLSWPEGIPQKLEGHSDEFGYLPSILTGMLPLPVLIIIGGTLLKMPGFWIANLCASPVMLILAILVLSKFSLAAARQVALGAIIVSLIGLVMGVVGVILIFG